MEAGEQPIEGSQQPSTNLGSSALSPSPIHARMRTGARKIPEMAKCLYGRTWWRVPTIDHAACRLRAMEDSARRAGRVAGMGVRRRAITWSKGCLFLD